MKTIKVPVELKIMLEEFGDGRSMNRVIEMLLEGVECPDAPVESKGNININISDELWFKLCCCKYFAAESHSSTIFRLLQNYQNNHK